ncbi:type IV secretory system conjugative DNA transfer family protein [Rubrivivax rivuli]|nr:type IV secretory system conjugative DNA transfer family protein [Rubrivivax rivuli]
MDPILGKQCRESYDRAKSERQRNPQAPEPPAAMLNDFNACVTFTQRTWPQWVASTQPAQPPMRTQEDRDREGLLYLRLPAILASLLVAALAFLHLRRLTQKRSVSPVVGDLVADHKRQATSLKANIVGAGIAVVALALDWRLFGLICMVLCWFGYVATFFLFKSKPSKTFGTARFASIEEVDRWNADAKAAAHKGATVRLGLAHPAGDDGEPSPVGVPLAYRTDKHVLVVASARSGKGRDLLIPNLLSYTGPVMVLDPKGENALRTGRHRESYGPVCYLDPWGITGRPSSGFNPLAELAASNSLEEVATGAAVIAGALVMPSDGPNRHFSDSARQLLEGLIAFVVTEPNLRPVADLTIVRQLLTQRLRPTLGAMAASTFGPDVIRSRAGTMLALSDGKEFSSIISTAATETDFLDNPTLQKNLGLDGVDAIDFSAWQRGSALSVYLCVPPDLLTVYSRWLRLVVIGALRAMTRRLSPPPQSVMFMLDELAALGRMKPVEDALGIGAGYGIQVWAVFQDLAQMKDTYKEKWPTFPGNAGLRCFFGVQDFDTAKYVSDMLGEATVEATSTNTSGGNNSTTTSAAKRQLRTPDEVMRNEGMFVLPPSSAPIYIERLAYFKDPELAGRWDEV